MSARKPPEFRKFDHSRFAEWPEYQAIARALGAFAHRCEAEDSDLTQREFERLAADLARHLLASDCCERCMAEGDLRGWVPYANEGEDGQVAGRYRCERGHEWTCWIASREMIASFG